MATRPYTAWLNAGRIQEMLLNPGPGKLIETRSRRSPYVVGQRTSFAPTALHFFCTSSPPSSPSYPSLPCLPTRVLPPSPIWFYPLRPRASYPAESGRSLLRLMCPFHHVLPCGFWSSAIGKLVGFAFMPKVLVASVSTCQIDFVAGGFGFGWS